MQCGVMENISVFKVTENWLPFSSFKCKKDFELQLPEFKNT